MIPLPKRLLYMLTDGRQRPPLWVWVSLAPGLFAIFVLATIPPIVIGGILGAGALLFLGFGGYIWIGEFRFRRRVRREKGE